MANRYDPMQNLPGYIPQAPSNLEGVSNEDLRQEMMKRVGQFGPIPMRRARGVLGGPVTIAEAQWYPGIRADMWHADAAGPDNGSWKTIMVRQGPGNLYDTDNNSLGLLVRLILGTGGAQNQTVYVSAVTNGVIHIPVCAETVIAEVALCQNVFTSTQLDAISVLFQGPRSLQSYFDNPPPVKPAKGNNFAGAGGARVEVGAVLGQGLATSQINNPARHISVVLAASGDNAGLPIPAGAQAIQIVSGCSDLVATFNVAQTSGVYGQETIPTASQATPSAVSFPTTIPDTADGINLTSAASGGPVTVIFYLGI